MRDSTAMLRVRDEGIGIPPEEKARIFEKFVRGEAAKKACIPGTGIGLAMVKEIVTFITASWICPVKWAAAARSSSAYR